MRAIIISLALLFSMQSLAQQNRTQLSIRRDAATVIFWGLGGAVLGLSTLSFYGEPQNHLGNIYAGLAIGLISGGFYVADQHAELQSSKADFRQKFIAYNIVQDELKIRHRPNQFNLAFEF